MWDPQRLTTLWASMACYRDSFYILWYAIHSCHIQHDKRCSFIDASSTSDYIASNDRMTTGWWTAKNIEGRPHGQIWGSTPLYAWRDWGKPPTISQDICSLGWHLKLGLSNMKQECHSLNSSIWWKAVLKMFLCYMRSWYCRPNSTVITWKLHLCLNFQGTNNFIF
jgi:hypothetical protein